MAKPRESINVWAHRIFAFKANKLDGWAYTFHFNKLADLIEQLQAEKLQGRIDKLVIVAHGDKAGLVQFDQTLNPETSESFAPELTKLGTFLASNGMLLFESCQAGSGEQGSQLLTRISNFLAPEQTVVGFIVNGLSPGMLGGFAGDIFEAPNSMPGMSASQFKGTKTRMTEESVYAKWARRGKIIRLPLSEEFAKLRGEWSVTSLKGPGKMSVQYSGATLRFGIDDIRVTQKGKTLMSARYTADLMQRPRTLDLSYTAGSDKSNKSAGILEFGAADFDALTIALSTPAKEMPKTRPVDFEYPPQSKHILIALKRLIA